MAWIEKTQKAAELDSFQILNYQGDFTIRSIDL